MFRSRFYWNLFLSYGGLVVLTSLIVGGLAYSRYEQALHRSVQEALRDQVSGLSVLGAEIFASSPQSELVRRIREASRESGTRITIIRTDGLVLIDTEADPAHMENHGTRPEVLAAKEAGWGISRRTSATLGLPELYVAKAAGTGDWAGYVRVAMPLAEEARQLSRMTRSLLYGTLGGILFALALGAWMARRITTPLNEMRVVAEAMRRGDYRHRVRALPRNEIGLLGDTFNRLSSELTLQIGNLAHEEAQLRGILAGMVEGVIAVDASDTILYHNRAAAELLGRSEAGELSGKKIWQFTELRGLRDLVEQARGKPDSVRREIGLSLDGGDRVLNVHGAPFATGVSAGAILVLHDITDLRRLESIRRDFVANVSHELKTPLTSIKGYVETLLEGALHDDKNNTRFMEKIHKHVEHLTELVQDLLALGEIESETRKLTVEPHDWNATLDEVVGRYELELSRKKLTFRREQGPTARVLGEGHALYQIASNLVSNAIKYTGEGGTVLVRTYEKDGFGCFEVVDTGVGIPEKELPRVFERFYRVDKARSREVGGTGLGLAIVKHLVQAMGGEIRVESRLGVGSKFTVRLPSPA